MWNERGLEQWAVSRTHVLPVSHGIRRVCPPSLGGGPRPRPCRLQPLPVLPVPASRPPQSLPIPLRALPVLMSPPVSPVLPVLPLLSPVTSPALPSSLVTPQSLPVLPVLPVACVVSSILPSPFQSPCHFLECVYCAQVCVSISRCAQASVCAQVCLGVPGLCQHRLPDCIPGALHE